MKTPKEWFRDKVYENQLGKKSVLSNPAPIGSSLSLAVTAVNHVKRILPIGEANRESNTIKTGGWSNEVLEVMRRRRKEDTKTDFRGFLREVQDNDNIKNVIEALLKNDINKENVLEDDDEKMDKANTRILQRFQYKKITHKNLREPKFIRIDSGLNLMHTPIIY